MVFELIGDLLFALNAGKASYSVRKKEVDNFRRRTKAIVAALQKESKTPQAKEHLSRIMHTVETTQIIGMPGGALKRAGNVLTMGEHIEMLKMRQNPYTKTWEVVRTGETPELIMIPQQHFFYNNKVTPRGALTLLHELVHGGVKNELMTDLLTIRIAARGGIPKSAVLRHLAGRGIVYGRGGIERARELADMAYARKEEVYRKFKPKRIPRRPPVRGRGRFRPAFARG